jgi:hypothetical protein
MFQRASSWFFSTPLPGRPRTFMPYAGGQWPYEEICTAIVEQNYAGFIIDRKPTALDRLPF